MNLCPLEGTSLNEKVKAYLHSKSSSWLSNVIAVLSGKVRNSVC